MSVVYSVSFLKVTIILTKNYHFVYFIARNQWRPCNNNRQPFFKCHFNFQRHCKFFCWVVFHTVSIILNVKQGGCKCKFLTHDFYLSGNSNLVYHFRDRDAINLSSYAILFDGRFIKRVIISALSHHGIGHQISVHCEIDRR